MAKMKRVSGVKHQQKPKYATFEEVRALWQRRWQSQFTVAKPGTREYARIIRSGTPEHKTLLKGDSQ